MNTLQVTVIGMAKALTPPREIAVELGMDPQKVRDILCNARRRGENIPVFKAPPREQIMTPERPTNLVIGLRLYRLLEDAAKRKGISPHELARDIIEAKLLKTEAPRQIEEMRHAR